MIVVYRSSAFLWRTIGSRIVTTRTFALVNLLAQRQLGRDAHVVPEFVPWFGDADPVVREAERLLSSPEVAERQRQELEAVVEPLRQGGAAGRAATIATALLQN